jgi:hypothetical protein
MYSLILVCLAGVAKSFLDISAHGKPFWFMGAEKLDSPNNPSAKKYDWWYMNRSWAMKWKNGDKEQGEKFLGSSTVFVFTTDAWHLAQFFFLNLMIAAMVCYEPIVNGLVDFLILSATLKITFELFYSRILVKK